MPPRLLCLDTTTERLVVAVTDGRDTLTLDEGGGALASRRILAAAQELMAQQGWAWPTLDAIAFARGPGAFTGLRTAASVTQGLCLGLDRPALAIDSLMIVADAAWQQIGPQARDARVRQARGPITDHTQQDAHVWVAMDARMGEIYAAAYHRSAADDWQTVWPAEVLSVDGFNAAFRRMPGPIVAGSALEVFAASMALEPDTVRLPDSGGRGDALARLALAAWGQGAMVDAALAVPVYVRDKVALTTAEREALAGNPVTAALVTHA